jgi:hypothetical protein
MKRLEDNKNEGQYKDYSGHNFNISQNSYAKKSILFSSREVIAGGFEGKFEIIFSDGTIDLSKVQIPLYNRTIKIDVVFSSGRIKIEENIPMLISVKSVFSSVRLPDRNGITFGGYDYVTRSFIDGQPHLHVIIDSVFCSTDVIRA